MEPSRALRDIAYELEKRGEPTYRVRAFRNAASVVDKLTPERLAELARTGRLTALKGIGAATASVIEDVLAGNVPEYLRKVEAEEAPELPDGGELLPALRGDCHTHSDWSDGGSPIAEMAEAARELGHEWMVLTDHSPRLTVANGLSAERLAQQLVVIAELNKELAPFRILSGIEVDILLDGALDQDEDLLWELDFVVASVHSELRMPRKEMTARMLEAVSNPRVNVLGHCTGRKVAGRNRPESEFDADKVFEACRDNGVAVEINSRVDRLDPPKRLLKQAVEIGCEFAIDSDAHAPGQLAWKAHGCARALECGVGVDQVVNTRTADDLLAWRQPRG
ncbi:PHP domain-containing protein [Amycolatopsis sp. YIM 10]|uniref:PHP domain-containing protein n=1 Tax=Amycolatopsis sp. YIM 10 TaxID=2653857 RepID=UPI0012903411|nr:PHP domain-containing protein [Amycolatopsis sp. YIM 10]QFU93123.1 DNA polymerase/3'-5' exonuclease PolX [Amycolatopsis sp. YIM 10]